MIASSMFNKDDLEHRVDAVVDMAICDNVSFAEVDAMIRSTWNQHIRDRAAQDERDLKQITDRGVAA